MNMEALQEAEFELQEELFEAVDAKSKSKILRQYVEKMDTKLKQVMPDFEEGLDWLNVPSSLSIKKDLQGKIVVLDFFTYCCVNCLHILPDLEALEKNYSIKDGVVVIGVHSAKFENEKVLSNILNAVLRYHINHPVVNDSEAKQWHNFQVACWPTLVVLGPDGQYLRAFVGEGHREPLFEFIEIALTYYKEKNEITTNDVALLLEKDKSPHSPLKFPGKVAINSDGKLLAVADTGHNRILVMDKEGWVLHTVGGKERGFQDGNFEEALFDSPQGMAFVGSDLYVADTENHAIRKIDIEQHVVTTVVGTGHQGKDTEGGKQGSQQDISSPWDLAVGSSLGSKDKDVLYIAMAGTHQIWVYFLQNGKWYKGRNYSAGTCVRFAGSGSEENRNNSYPEKAAFAQPSGITLSTDPGVNTLYVADSESSTIRSISLKDGSVKALVGGERDPMNLFAYGDTDGVGVSAKLQHPLGVALLTEESGPLLVADSYNHKIKCVDLKSKSCATWKWSTDTCKEEGAIVTDLNEPGGICVDCKNRIVYIADTNHHAVKVINLETKTVYNLPIQFPSVVDGLDQNKKAVDFVKPNMPTEEVPAASVKPGGELELRLTLNFPEGIHLTDEAPSRWMLNIKDKDESLLNLTCDTQGSIIDNSEQVLVIARLPHNGATDCLALYLKCRIFFCDESNMCRMKEKVFRQNLTLQAGSHNCRHLSFVLSL